MSFAASLSRYREPSRLQHEARSRGCQFRLMALERYRSASGQVIARRGKRASAVSRIAVARSALTCDPFVAVVVALMAARQKPALRSRPFALAVRRVSLIDSY